MPAPPTSADSSTSAPPKSTPSTTSTVNHMGPSGPLPSFASPLTDFASLSLALPALIGTMDSGYTSRSGSTTIPAAEAVDSRRESVPLCGESQLNVVETEDDSMDGEDGWTPIARRERRESEAGVDMEMKREEVVLVLTEGEVETRGEREDIKERQDIWI